MNVIKLQLGRTHMISTDVEKKVLIHCSSVYIASNEVKVYDSYKLDDLHRTYVITSVNIVIIIMAWLHEQSS